MGLVYLIHFEKKLHHAQHYLGYCDDETPDRRFARHKSGQGAKILRALNLKGIEYKIVRIWNDVSKDFERSLKNRKKARCLCPECNEKARDHRFIPS